MPRKKKQCCDSPDVHFTRQGEVLYVCCSGCRQLLDEIGTDGKKVNLKRVKARKDREAEKNGNGNGLG